MKHYELHNFCKIFHDKVILKRNRSFVNVFITKIESILFVPENLTFSEYLRCLNFPLWTFWPAKTKQVKESYLFSDKAPTRSGRFKHLKFSENDKFSGTNSVVSILGIYCFSNQGLR